MGIFSSIMSKIFGHKVASAAAGSPTTAATSAVSAPAAAAPAGQAPPAVDVEAVLNDMAGRNAQTLDWRHSIVDLMKLLDLDSSFGARRELATELGYSGDPNDSAAMNIWLHRQVMAKLAENGGRVPDVLRS